MSDDKKRSVGFASQDVGVTPTSLDDTNISSSLSVRDAKEEKKLRRRSLSSAKKLHKITKATTLRPGDLVGTRLPKPTQTESLPLSPVNNINESLPNETASRPSDSHVIIVNQPGYWIEGYSSEPPPPDDAHSFGFFRLQDFNNHYHYHKYFYNVEHANFMADTPEVGPVLVSITREPSYPNGMTRPTRPKRSPGVYTLRRLISLRGAKDDKDHDKKDDKKEDKKDEKEEETKANSNDLGLSSVPSLNIADAVYSLTQSDTFDAVPQAPFGSGFYRALIRTKLGDVPVKIPETAFKKERPGRHELLEALKTYATDVPFSWETSDFKELNVSPDAILEMESRLMMKGYKFGIIYAKQGQSTDDEMLSNRETSTVFETFLKLIGDKIELKGWPHYNGGLDTKHDSTGSHSIFTNFKNCEIMFHVSTMLPHSDVDQQQLEKKRHIGNDIVVLVFQEGDTPFDPTKIKSFFNHVFIVVRPIKPGTKIEGPLPQPIGYRFPKPLPLQQLRLASAESNLSALVSPRVAKPVGDQKKVTLSIDTPNNQSGDSQATRVNRSNTIVADPASISPEEDAESTPQGEEKKSTRVKKLRRTKSVGIDKSDINKAVLKAKTIDDAPTDFLGNQDRQASKSLMLKRRSAERLPKFIEKKKSLERDPSDPALVSSPSLDSLSGSGSESKKEKGLFRSKSKENLKSLDRQISEKSIPRQSSKDKILDRQVSERILVRESSKEKMLDRQSSERVLPKLDLESIDELSKSPSLFALRLPKESERPETPKSARKKDKTKAKEKEKEEKKEEKDSKASKERSGRSKDRKPSNNSDGDNTGTTDTVKKAASTVLADKPKKKKERVAESHETVVAGDFKVPSSKSLKRQKSKSGLQTDAIDLTKSYTSIPDDSPNAQNVPATGNVPPLHLQSNAPATTHTEPMTPKSKRRLSESPRDKAHRTSPRATPASPRLIRRLSTDLSTIAELPLDEQQQNSTLTPVPEEGSDTTGSVNSSGSSGSGPEPPAQPEQSPQPPTETAAQITPDSIVGPSPSAPCLPTSAERRNSINRQRQSQLLLKQTNRAKSFVKYRVEIVSKDGVVSCEPSLPNPPIFSHGPYFKEFLLTKMVNYERAAFFAESFSKPLERTRLTLLTELYQSRDK